MKIKTTELTGAALDWAVAKCEGASVDVLDNFTWRTSDEDAYSTDWSQSGPIIEREGINIQPVVRPEGWIANDYGKAQAEGPTPLIAAMRCYASSKLGDEVDVPEELLS